MALELLDGWHPDHTGRHHERFYDGGPTFLVRDDGVESQDDPREHTATRAPRTSSSSRSSRKRRRRGRGIGLGGWIVVSGLAVLALGLAFFGTNLANESVAKRSHRRLEEVGIVSQPPAKADESGAVILTGLGAVIVLSGIIVRNRPAPRGRGHSSSR